MVNDRLPLRDPEVYALARELDRLRRQIHDVEVASQGAFRSVEDGAIDVYDDNDVLRERIGRQADGTYGRKSFAGDPPPAPTDPDVQVIGDGVVAVTWDGRFEEKYLTGEFRAVQVHLGDTVDFGCTRNTMEGALFTRWGGTVVVVTESDDDNPVYVKLRAINRAGVVGAESAGVLVDEDDDLGLEDDEEEQWEANDAHTLTAADVTAGVATVQLSHLPEVESVSAVWGVLPQEPTEYAVDYDTGIVTWPLEGFEEVGDRLWFHYTHQSGPASLNWGADGWKYLQVATTDTTDRSGVGYDDSGFATGTTPIGNVLTTHTDPAAAGWLTPVTAAWADNTDLWLRRNLAGTPGTSVTITVRIDNYITGLWWNGQLVGSYTTGNVAERSFTVPGGDVLESNVLALRLADETVTGDRTYVDVNIEGAS